jgi:hypothetical protein
MMSLGVEKEMQCAAYGFIFFVHFATLRKTTLPRNEEYHKSLWHPIVLMLCLTLVKTLAPFETSE